MQYTLTIVATTFTNLEFGTCSWNYDPWIGLVYDKKAEHSAAYLSQYSKHYRTVEVDSCFYKLPDPSDVSEYKSRVPPDFTFARKLTESISLTHERNRDKTAPLISNPDFLSVEQYAQYVSNIGALIPQVFLLELEFEYLNRQKMADLTLFMKAIESFVTGLDARGLRDAVPLAIECRNANYLKREYFQFLMDQASRTSFPKSSIFLMCTKSIRNSGTSSATSPGGAGSSRYTSTTTTRDRLPRVLNGWKR